MSNHKPITQEMIDDLSCMGDKEFSKKWNTSRQYPIRNRKRLGIKPFNNKHGTKDHIIEDGIEKKWCPMDGGHYAPLESFSDSIGRKDGLRGVCKIHDRAISKKSYIKRDGAKVARMWSKTESGRVSKRNTWRKSKAKKVGAYIFWLPEHEQMAYEYFGGRCAYCGKSVEFLKIEFDHFIPIKSGGKTHPNNMLPCCHKCNHGTGGKFTKDALEWLHEKFGELNGNMIYLVCQTALEHLGQNSIGIDKDKSDETS